MKPVAALPVLCAATCVRAISVSVGNSSGIAVNPLMYGLIFEDINYSGDGGIYAGLIQNRAFQSGSGFTPWTAFGGQFNTFDCSNVAHQTLIGEYSMQRGTYPSWIGAVGEAIFELGAEKNGDKIIGMSYAPSFMNSNSHQWTPDLITFNADASQTTLSTSYRQIKPFSNNRIKTSLPLNNSDKMSPAYWIAGRNDKDGKYMLKAAVYDATAAQPFTVMFPGLGAGDIGTLTVLTSNAGPQAYNQPGKHDVVVETISSLNATSAGFEFGLPALSVAVLSWNITS